MQGVKNFAVIEGILLPPQKQRIAISYAFEEAIKGQPFELSG